ncbi:hypothetical protein C0J52_01440 [Blattella germanica]|nr:hypothetical protein C0J52_01440 [Blattella germanica]
MKAQDFYEEVVVDQIPQFLLLFYKKKYLKHLSSINYLETGKFMHDQLSVHYINGALFIVVLKDSTPLILDKKTEEDSFDGLEDRNQEEEKAEDDKEPNEETLTLINAAEILDVELGFLKLLLKNLVAENWKYTNNCRRKKWSLCHILMSLSEDTIIVSFINFTNFLYGPKKKTSSSSGAVELYSQLELHDETRQRTNKEEKKQLNYAVTQENLRQIEAVEQSVERMSKRFDDFIEARQEEIPLLMEDDDNNEILTNMTDLEYEILKVEEKTIKDDKLYKEFQKQQTLIRLQYESAIRIE